MMPTRNIQLIVLAAFFTFNSLYWAGDKTTQFSLPSENTEIVGAGDESLFPTNAREAIMDQSKLRGDASLPRMLKNENDGSNNVDVQNHQLSNDTSLGSIENDDHNIPSTLGAVVFLAPPRNSRVGWDDRTDRFCMLMRAIRSVDQHLNLALGANYPIYILVARDYDKADLHKKDGLYTERDRAVLRSWAPHSSVTFVEIDMYSNLALEPDTTRSEIMDWRQFGRDGAVKGRDLGYQSMCRLWSGRLQLSSVLVDTEYYMRMDDDSLLTHDLPFDPFLEMKQKDLLYTWRRDDYDHWGVDQLWQLAKPHVKNARSSTDTMKNSPIIFMEGDDNQTEITTATDYNKQYTGKQPYNNFHISKVAFWRSPQWKNLWEDMDRNHLFFKYRVGDANVHAIALMMMESHQYERWPKFPYVHNVNDDKNFGGMGNLQQFECNAEFQNYDRMHSIGAKNKNVTSMS